MVIHLHSLYSLDIRHVHDVKPMLESVQYIWGIRVLPKLRAPAWYARGKGAAGCIGLRAGVTVLGVLCLAACLRTHVGEPTHRAPTAGLVVVVET
jgi:hypothetical protein